MHGDRHARTPCGREELSTIAHDAHLGSQKCRDRGGAQRHDRGGPHERQLLIEPHAARQNLFPAGPLVDAAFAARLPLEMFDGVRQIHLRRIAAGFDDDLAQEASGGPDKRLSLDIFDIARLLAHQHHVSCSGTRSKHRLRRVFP